MGLEIGEVPYGKKIKDRFHDARDKTGQEQFTDGLLRDNAVDNENNTGRNQDPHAAAGRNASGGQGRIVIMAPHLRQRDHTHGGRRGRAGSADGGKPGAGADGCHGQPAAHVAQPFVCRVVQPLADA